MAKPCLSELRKTFKNKSQYILQGLQELPSYSLSVQVEDSLMKVLIDQFWGLQKTLKLAELLLA